MTYTRNLQLLGFDFHIVSDGAAITRLERGTAEETELCPVIETALHQLREYEAGTRRDFDLPMAPTGTEFQLSVWETLRTIPYGETRSYGDIAAQIGKPKATRAVGGACNKNHILLLIPCHRVIGKNGSLTGFGAGLDMKEVLLTHEAPSPFVMLSEAKRSRNIS